jgi:MoaA/NifB/PqqE/SkfB family radical SAM enzyme
MGQIKLHEIIWEITGACHNACSYCGSSSLWNQEINTNRIKKIVDAIAKYPPVELDISGGDPLLVDQATHEYLLEKLSPTTKCKIIINPKSFRLVPPGLNVLDQYAHVGISINTEEEIQAFKESSRKIPSKYRTTVITNFNLGNIFLFDQILELSQKYATLWQIQYTMYDTKNEALALYKNKEAINFLGAKISTALSINSQIIVADNANNGKCSAGVASIGIASNGDVIPCLSMRSWKEFFGPVVNNIFQTPLQKIWETNFYEQRFGEFKCCKDHCGNAIIPVNLPNKALSLGEGRNLDPNEIITIPNIPFQTQPIVCVYAVTTNMINSNDPKIQWTSTKTTMCDMI